VFSRKLPLSYQLAQILRAEVLAGRFPPGAKIPPEVALARQYGVSFATVRQALRSLEEEGLISRHRARGTFVAPDLRPRRELRLVSSVDALIAQQLSEETEVLGMALVPVPPHLEPYFGREREVSLFRRLRREQGAPVSYALNYVLPEYGSQIEPEALRRDPVLKILRDRTGVKLKAVRISVEAQAASPEVARLLDVEPFSPVLFFFGLVHDRDGRVIDVPCIHYRADRFKFAVDLDVGQ
jgi:GntR family transcriptional regulator